MAHARNCRPLGLALLLAGLPIGIAHCADVLTQHYDNARTGAILSEKLLNISNVKSQTFGKLWTLYADGQVVAQPLYVSGLDIDTSSNPDTPLVRGKFNAVIIATMHNTVYVYDADKQNRGPDDRTMPLWAKWLGPPKPSDKQIDMWSTNDPEWGIVSTPVVSDDRTTLYVTAWHNDDGKIQHRLHALDLATGLQKRQADIGPSSRSPGIDCGQDQIPFNPCRLKQRSALLLHNGLLYLGFGGDHNRGALVVADAQTLQPVVQWATTPTGADGGIWQSGQGPAADHEGNIYLNTGNGTFDGVANFGNSTLRIARQGQAIAVKDYFTPCNISFLNQRDLDLGSAGPLLISDDPPRIVTGGKQGVLYVLDPANLGKHVPGPGGDIEDCNNTNIKQQVRAFDAVQHDNETHWGNIHGSPVYWKSRNGAWIYAWGENSPLKAYSFAQGRIQNPGNPTQSGFRPPLGMPGGMLALSADADVPGSGIVWALVPLTGDANKQRGVQGILLALDAQDVSRTLWTSEQVAARDSLGLFPKFNPPLVVDGKVFVPTYGDSEQLRIYGGDHPNQFPQRYYVAVYGLDPPAAARQVVNQSTGDITVVRAEISPLDFNIDLNSGCDAVDAGTVDCSKTLAALAQAPVFHRVLFSKSQDLGSCSLVRLTTASRDPALPSAAGVGFWSSQMVGGNLSADNSGLFSAIDKLKQAGTARLKNGDAARLHQFVGVSNCLFADGVRVARLFKPYLRFENAATGPLYQNWDVSDNYRVQGADTAFDRGGDVLQ